MVLWSRKLYVGSQAAKKKHKYQRNVEQSKLVPGLYLITPSASARDLLDILPAHELLQPFYRNRDITVFGMAMGYSEALSVTEEMIMDCYRGTGEFDLAAWFGD